MLFVGVIINRKSISLGPWVIHEYEFIEATDWNPTDGPPPSRVCVHRIRKCLLLYYIYYMTMFIKGINEIAPVHG